MSHAELMSLVDRSTEEERIFLAAYLRHVAKKNDQEYLRQLKAADREITEGKAVDPRIFCRS